MSLASQRELLSPSRNSSLKSCVNIELDSMAYDSDRTRNNTGQSNSSHPTAQDEENSAFMGLFVSFSPPSLSRLQMHGRVG